MLDLTLSRAKLSQSGPLKHPGCPEAIRMLSGGYPDLIGMDHHTFYPPWNRELPEPSFKKSLLLDWRSVIFTKMTS